MFSVNHPIHLFIMDPTAYRPKYEIPLEYQGDLEYVGGMSDNRSDPEILAALSRYQPITPGSNKHVWAFWHAGITEMPGWQQRNVMVGLKNPCFLFHVCLGT